MIQFDTQIVGKYSAYSKKGISNTSRSESQTEMHILVPYKKAGFKMATVLQRNTCFFLRYKI